MMFSSSQSTCYCFNRSLRLPTLLIAALGIVTCPLAADAQDAPKNDVQVIDFGLKPDIFCSGAVVVPKTDNLYLTFHATKDGVNGLAVIQLENCLDRRFRAPGDEAYAWHPVDIEALSVCETYEVTNSSWAAKLHSLAGGDRSEDSGLHHYVFTFLGHLPGVCERAPNFECIAASANVDFLQTDSYDDVMQHIDYREMTISEPPTSDASDSDADSGEYTDEYMDEYYSSDPYSGDYSGEEPDETYSQEYYDSYYSSEYPDGY